MASHTILIVEDEVVLHDALRDVLAANGYQVTVASNGEEGLAMAHKDHPELILLDVMMPKMDGITMLKELRKTQTEPQSRVIFFTNLSQMQKIADALKEGADGYIVKAEASLSEIVEKVDAFFKTK